MIPATTRYVSDEEDSGRWNGFPFRAGDIVISTRSKSGTTWLQMICALLIFQQPEPPAPLAELSPWLDWKIRPVDEVHAHLAAQTHRRFIKTHTPLDGLPLDDKATYVVVARDPRDMYVSLYHQGANIDRDVMRRLLGQPDPGQPAPDEPDPEQPASEPPGIPRRRPDVHQALLAWIDSDDSPHDHLDSIRGVMWHLSDAWALRHQPDIVLVHYTDLLQDLGSEMRKLADRLQIQVSDNHWPALVEAATFAHMRDRAERLVPSRGLHVLMDVNAFFRQGTSGSWREILTAQEVAHYEHRVSALAPPDLLEWLHR